MRRFGTAWNFLQNAGQERPLRALCGHWRSGERGNEQEQFMQLANSMKWSYHLAPLVPFAVVVLGCSLLGRTQRDTVNQTAPILPNGHPLVEMEADHAWISPGMSGVPRGGALHFHRGSPGWSGRTWNDATPREGYSFSNVNTGVGRPNLLPAGGKPTNRSWMETY
jgi:hypothetical protein